uniref:Uncharacterized protein n=1 Tax=Agrobacterium tumefaciens TaxID=358 RepID=A0A3Q8BA10_AGRTU|nr:hypothetical protein AgrTiEU6_81 [Agrobacterium tumefaciens]
MAVEHAEHLPAVGDAFKDFSYRRDGHGQAPFSLIGKDTRLILAMSPSSSALPDPSLAPPLRPDGSRAAQRAKLYP